MILIFDTWNGLCNQILDIQSSIYFSKCNQLQFTFRYCSFRNDDLKSFYSVNFNKLFDINPFLKFNNFIKFENIQNKINNDNTFNYEGTNIINIVKNETDLMNLINEQINKNIDFFIVKQIFPICNFSIQKNKFYNKIKPSPYLFSIYLHLKKNILPDKYNFIHYRYEQDFTNFFKINNIISIDSLIQNQKFKNKNIKIYIASSNLKSLSKTLYLTNDLYDYKNIIFKDDYLIENNLNQLNFEQKAFIDFLIGLSSCEVIGHTKSSFSKLLHLYKQTKLFYDIY